MKMLYGAPVINRNTFGPVKGLREILTGKDVQFYGYGRVALLEGLTCIDIKENDEVIIPSFICNVVKSPFNLLKVKVRYYKVNPDISPDCNDIMAAINSRTKAIM